MKFSSKVKKCGLSPMRKFHPYAVAAEAKGRKIYHLNIGQPDVETPPQFFEAVRNFQAPVLEYAPSPGVPELIDAIQSYYDKLNMHFEKDEILITTGGSEALSIVFQCILDDGDEVLIPEPFYPNYSTMVYTTGASIHPIPTSPEEGYRYADRAKIEAQINEHTRAIVCTNPGNPTGVVLTPEERRLMCDIAKEHNLFLIGDEAYREFVYAGEPLQSFGEYADLCAENIIVIDTVSKRFSACGARVGCILSRNHELLGEAMKYCQARLSVATLDQVASAPCIKWVRSTLPPCARNTSAAGIPWWPSWPRSPASSVSAPRAPSTSWLPCRWTMPTSSSNGCWRNSRTTATL